MLVFADVEADGLKPTKVHCIAVLTPDFEEPILFTDMNIFYRWVSEYKTITWVFHNGLGYDVDAINKLTPVTIDKKNVIDTLVVSKTLNYSRFNTHSLKELGTHLGVYKGGYSGGWDKYTDEMGEYCKQDVKVLKAVYGMYQADIMNPQNKRALRVEHDFATVCKDMSTTGFPFDKEKAELLLDDVQKEMDELEEGFQSLLSSKRVEVKRIKMRYKKDGDLMATSVRALTENPDVEIQGDEIVVYGQSGFNPGSPKQRVDALWEYGWKPVDKTIGHIKSLRSGK